MADLFNTATPENYKRLTDDLINTLSAYVEMKQYMGFELPPDWCIKWTDDNIVKATFTTEHNFKITIEPK